MSHIFENMLPVVFDQSTIATHAVIAAPGAGKRIAIDFITLNPSGGANTVTLHGSVDTPFELNDNQPLTFENAIHNPKGIYPCDTNQAFEIQLSAATRVTGFILYRIIE